jgi:hypothetical protein
MSVLKQWWGRLMLALNVLVDDNHPGWQPVSYAGDGPSDRAWADHYEDLTDALEAWDRNFLIRQIVRLTTAYVIGDTMTVSAEEGEFGQFVREFADHDENRLVQRLPAWCDELTRSGEIFVALFPDAVSGMCYIRELPATQIERVLTDPQDYEKHLGYRQVAQVLDVEGDEDEIGGRLWASVHTAEPGEPVLLHYKINRVVGRTRGQGDLGPVLPWAKRYTTWLNGRVDLNELRARMAAVDIEIENDRDLATKQAQYEANPPIDGGLFIHGKGETLRYQAMNVQGWDAEPDGRVLRLALAAGANVPLHFLSEGSSANRSTAAEMGDPTRRHYRMRQNEIRSIVADVVRRAYECKAALGLAPRRDSYPVHVAVPDISRQDNESLANAASTIVAAFATMKENGWIDDETAIRLSFKFAGEVLGEEKIQEILGGSDSGSNETPE